MQFRVEKVVPVVAWPKSVYSGNCSHIASSTIQQMSKEHKVRHFTAAVSHPQCVGLSYRYFEMVRERVRLKCIAIGSLKNCSLHVKDALIDVNIRCVRNHGNTPSVILLGFNPATSTSSIVGHSEDKLGN